MITCSLLLSLCSLGLIASQRASAPSLEPDVFFQSDDMVEGRSSQPARGDSWYRSEKSDNLTLPKDPFVSHYRSVSLTSDVVGPGFTIADIVAGPTPHTVYLLKRRTTSIAGRGPYSDFDLSGAYERFNEGRIEEDCIIQYHLKEKRVISSFGANTFYHPAGLTVDPDGSVWVADTALRQVLQFNDGSKFPVQCIESRFFTKHGEDQFCGPMDVSVTSHHIYIADGLCKSRVVMFDRRGEFVSMFNVTEDPTTSSGTPMNIVIDVPKNKLYVTKNALNGDHTRLLVVNAGIRDPRRLGEEIALIYQPGVKSFQSLALHPSQSKLYAINQYTRHDDYHRGFTFQSQTMTLKGYWIQSSNNPRDQKGFYHPLAMTLSKTGKFIYVIDKENSEHKVLVFRNEGIIQTFSRLRTYNGRSARNRIMQIISQRRLYY